MSRRIPAPPRGGTSLCWPLTTTATKKWGEIPFTTTSFTGILTQSTVCSMYPNYRPFWYLWHTMHWKKSYILNCKQRQFVADAINHGVKANFSSLQLFDCVWTMVYNNVTYFAMTVYPWYYLARVSYPPSPGGTPQPPRGDILMFIFLATTAAKNGGKNPFTTTLFTGTLIHCIFW